jgi:hypothetical protein
LVLITIVDGFEAQPVLSEEVHDRRLVVGDSSLGILRVLNPAAFELVFEVPPISEQRLDVFEQEEAE